MFNKKEEILGGKNQKFKYFLIGVAIFIIQIVITTLLETFGFPEGQFVYGLVMIIYSLGAFFLFYKQLNVGQLQHKRPHWTIGNWILILITSFIPIALYMTVLNGSEELDAIFKSNMVTILTTIFVAVAAGLVEEVVTRGFLFQSMYNSQRRYSFLLASVGSSILFGAFHITNLGSKGLEGTLQQIFYATVVGLMFCAIRIGTNNILLGIFLHSLLDFQLNVVESTSSTGSGSGTPWAAYLIVFTPVLVISLLTIMRLESRKNKLNKLERE